MNASHAHMVSLSGELTIAQAAQQRDALLPAIRLASAPGGALTLSLADVEAIDSAGIQLLIAASHSLRSAGAELTITEPSSVARDALAIYGLNPWPHAGKGART